MKQFIISCILIICVVQCRVQHQSKKHVFLRNENTQAPIVLKSEPMVRVDPEYDDNIFVPQSQLQNYKPVESRSHQVMDHQGNIVQHHVIMQRNAHGRVTSFSKMQTTNGIVDFVHHRHIGRRLK